MRYLLSYALLATLAYAFPAQFESRDDDTCGIEYVYPDGSAAPAPGTNKPVSAAQTTNTANATTSVTSETNTTASTGDMADVSASNMTTNSTSALKLTTLASGEEPIALNDDYIHAPEDNTPVPADAAIYTPPTAGVFDYTDFMGFLAKQRESPSSSKLFMKVAPGTYQAGPVPTLPAGSDPNDHPGQNIVLHDFKPGYTLDLRGVTLFVDISAKPGQEHRTGVIIYVNHAPQMTIIGGTIWADQGELYSQAHLTGTTGNGDATTASFKVDAGYNVSVWRTAGPRNQDCMDVSDPQHFKNGQCNFWYWSKPDFSKLDSDHTFTAQIADRSNLKVGQVLAMYDKPDNSPFVVSNEDGTGLTVKSLTTNGGFMSIGGDPNVPHLVNVRTVNPPPRPGYAPRVLGPMYQWGKKDGFVYNAPGLPVVTSQNTFWQTTGAPGDLQDGQNLEPAA